MPDPAPLVLTLGLDAASFARLDALRRQHFPPARNHLPAHLTLFHALPGAEREGIAATLAALAARMAPPPLRIVGLRNLGRGVAFAVESPALTPLRGQLAATWHSLLTPQDRQPFRPHVTVQNKVAPEAARALFELLRQGFIPWEGRGESLLLWHYRGGPWEAAAQFPLTG